MATWQRRVDTSTFAETQGVEFSKNFNFTKKKHKKEIYKLQLIHFREPIFL